MHFQSSAPVSRWSTKANRSWVSSLHPLLNQLFRAARETGAWLNETTSLPLLGKAIPPMLLNAPQKGIFSCEWGKHRWVLYEGNLYRKVDIFFNMAAKTGGREGKGGMVHGVRSLGRATAVLSFKYRHGQLRYLVGRWMLRIRYSSRYLPLQDVSRLITTGNPPNGPGNGSYRTRQYW